MDDDAAVLDLVLGKLEGVRQRGGYWMAKCPAHADREASLSVKRGTEQPVIFYCHAGCDRDAILTAAGLTLDDISKPREQRPGEWTPRGEAIAVYDYVDEAGVLLFQVCRTADKQFPQRRPDPLAKSGWSWKLGGVRRVLYRLPQLRQAIADGVPVYIAEGEKDVHAIERAGGVATTSPGGAGKWREDYNGYFRGARVIIVADADEPGRKHAAEVKRHLQAIAASVVVREAATGKDAADHLAAGLTLDDLTGQPPSVPVPIAQLNGHAGSSVLDEVHDFLGRFVAYPSTEAHVAHTLWVAHTHFMDAWESTPRIAFLSPEPGSGKTRALEVSELLVQRPVEAINTTPAYLFRKVSDPEGLPVILYDEVDTLFGPRTAKDNEEIRGMLNAGHRRGAMAGRCVVKGKVVETEELAAYCAVALAGLGDLPGTLMSRAVVIRMRRRGPEERVEPYRRRVHKEAGHQLRDRLTMWANHIMPKVTGAWPDMPEGIEDRNADVWEALLAVADAAGGDWPERARVAAVTLVTAAMAAPPSLGVKLLTDLRQVFGGHDVMSTEAILTALHELDEAPWADLKGKPLNPRGLAHRLRQYGVHSTTIRIGDVVAKGYKREDLHDPWSRYLGPAGEIPGGVSVGPPHIEDVTDVTSGTPAMCFACGLPMDPKLAAQGHTIHPTCGDHP